MCFAGHGDGSGEDLKLKPAASVTLGDQVEGCWCPGPPTSLTLIKAMQLRGRPRAVCLHQGLTYVGLVGTFGADRIDEQGNVTQGFINLPVTAISIRALRNILFVLVNGKDPSLNIYNLEGLLLFQIRHADRHLEKVSGNKLAIVGGYEHSPIIACDLSNQRFTTYMPTRGQHVVKQIDCKKLQENNNISMCIINERTVVLSNSQRSSIACVKLETGDVVWETNRVTHPQGVVCYRGHFVMVACRDEETKIHLIDAQTGEQIFSSEDNHS